MKLGLVLGAGGVVGMDYHAGVLHALVEEGGLEPASADLIVGTSAGSVVGSLLRSGWTAADLWSFALGTHPMVADLPPHEVERRRRATLSPRFDTPFEAARLAVGSAYVLARSVLRVPVPQVPRPIARRFPGGLFTIQEAEERLTEVLPEVWPDDPLWLVAVDLVSGRRVVLGRRGAPEVGLHTGVLASCSIPGVYPPVRAGEAVLVDGGAHSSTHLDLAARAGCDLIVGVAPMAYDPADAPGRLERVARRWPTRALAGEAREARARGAQVLLVRPGAADLRHHGMNAMRPDDDAAIARAAYESTCRLLATERFRRVLDDLEPTAA
jgi:NTE family protein